jgi:hypothetical protein
MITSAPGVTLRNFIVNHIGVVGAISCYRCDRTVDLIKQLGHRRDITDIVRGQFDGDDLMAIGINREMEFAPVPTGSFAVLLLEPFTLAVHLGTGAVDQRMQRFTAFNRFRQKCQAIPTTAECRVIRNSDVNVEKLSDRSRRSLDLAQSRSKNEARCQTGLDRQIGINWLTTALSGGRRVPCGDPLIGQPNREAPPPNQAASYSGQFVTLYFAFGIL